MDQALKSLIAAEEEVEPSVAPSGQPCLRSAHRSLPLGAGEHRGPPARRCHSHILAFLFSPLPHSAISTVSPHCAFTPHPATHPLQ